MTPRLAILIPCALAQDQAAGALLSGNTGTIIRDLLGKAGIGWSQCKVFALYPGYAPGNDAVAVARHCRGPVDVTLAAALKEYAPVIILALGQECLRFLSGEMKASIGDYRGTLFECEVN